MNTRTGVIGGLGLGASVMYLLDPERGRRRRAMLRDGMVSRAIDSELFLRKSRRDIGNRARGMAARTRNRVFPSGPVEDDVLAERVRSKMGRYVSHPGAIEVSAAAGRVALRGPVLADEARGLIRAIESVRGVRDVEDRLELYSEPGAVPALQGGARRAGETPELLERRWSPAARVAGTGVAGTLLVLGLKRRGGLGMAATALGTGLLARAISNRSARRLTGLGAGRRAVDYRKTITIDAPVEEVYDAWSRVENFPRILSHIREVRDIGNGRTRWTATGPAGVPVSWDAVVTEEVPGEVLAWQSEPGSMIDNAGVIRFEPVDDGEATRVDIHLSYNPPAGSVGDVVASLLGADPKSAMDEDLIRFQSVLEQRRTGNGRETTREDLAEDDQRI